MKKAYEFICRIEGVIAQVTLFVMVVLVCVAGFMRTLGHPINWAVDMATFLFAWCCFFSADIAWRNDKLIIVDAFIKWLPEKAKWYIRMIHYFIIVIFLAYLIVFGSWLSYTTRARTFQGIPGFSYTWVTLSLPVGAILLLITTVLKIRRELAGGANALRQRSEEAGY
ncbi:TRAP transporter small permease [Moorella sulfitireducens]|uniref:TRAP transporter small permease n=1 Tax=Neomoorella sulfitireducens TaxID=2972948 RepID=UPI0021ABB9F9|nr:TRAP transporter small permease subunit [Moorella sulfitireducens]